METKRNQTNISDEMIEAFLKGKLSETEAESFRSALREDAELRARAVSMAVLIKTMQKIGQERDQKVLNEINNRKGTTISFSGYMKRAMAIAACLCVLFTVYDYHRTNVKTTDLAQTCLTAYTPPMPSLEDLSRGRGDTQTLENESKVLTELEGLFNQVKNHQADTGDIAKLKEKLELSLDSKVNLYTDYYKQIGYYLAVAYLQDSDRKSAKETLKRILDIDPDFTEAKILLDQITEIRFFWGD